VIDALGVDAGVVVRWNLGGNQKYEAALERFAPFNRLVDPDLENRSTIEALCAEALDADRRAFVIVNNKAEGSAPLSVFALSDAIQTARNDPNATSKESSR
jgi:hypothetical protein